MYRRWPTVDHLAAAALLKLTEADNPLPDTGALDSDLHALLSQIVDLLNRPEILRVVRGVAALNDDGPASSAKAAFFDARFADATRLIDRAVERGELPPGVDADRTIETLAAPAYMRALLENQPLDADLIDSSVAIAIAGARATAQSRTSSDQTRSSINRRR
ncbi:transcriptional regulator, TetR family protein [Gordonia neofelifaecis NRRL B-59395]|uniref:Transcriptional regulator, TetR family protein n=1 Tax=Gordonia neofelifaecis NRRL B-59395 TaxID=644548 RepID=F1YNI6_9ACTN|nr:transcriptional regulator, TetR family protein [Gordonia neofelifaecis NRRL B-59395]